MNCNRESPTWCRCISARSNSPETSVFTNPSTGFVPPENLNSSVRRFLIAFFSNTHSFTYFRLIATYSSNWFTRSVSRHWRYRVNRSGIVRFFRTGRVALMRGWCDRRTTPPSDESTSRMVSMSRRMTWQKLLPGTHFISSRKPLSRAILTIHSPRTRYCRSPRILVPPIPTQFHTDNRFQPFPIGRS